MIHADFQAIETILKYYDEIFVDDEADHSEKAETASDGDQIQWADPQQFADDDSLQRSNGPPASSQIPTS